MCSCACMHLYFVSFVHLSKLNEISYNSEVCKPSCKFGICNTTIGECICPPGHSGADCSVRGMLCVCMYARVHVCVKYIIIIFHASVFINFTSSCQCACVEIIF